MRTSPRRQQGVVAVIVAVALFAVLAMAGLALDAGHSLSNKARFQNVVDAAALAAAKALDQSGSTTIATTAANAVFDTNRAAFPSLESAGGVGVAVEYSNTVAPFAAGSTPERYVRVTATNFRNETSFSRVVGVNELVLRASAVSGPSPSIGTACNIAPMMVCGDPAAGAPDYGFSQGQLQILKIGSQGSSPVGPGNFLLIRLGGSGGSIVRENLAGGYQGCASLGDSVETQTGNVVGPVAQGMNTRFGEYSGGGMSATDYPPDVVTRTPTPQLSYDSNSNSIRQGGTVVTTASQINYNYATYTAQVTASSFDNTPAPDGIGAYGRREIAVPFANCSGANSGNSTLPVLGFGCFFLLQEVEQSGQESIVYAQYLQNCTAGGTPGPAPTTNPGPYIIQLYRDSASPDS